MTPLTTIHPIAGHAIHIPANPAASVGNPVDPARRPHVFRCPDMFVRTICNGSSWQLQPFLTVAQARSVMTRGQYHECRRLIPELRSPDTLMRFQTDLGDTPLEGLSHREAEILAQLTGGRLPTEREVDYILGSLPTEASPDHGWHCWTASIWSPFSYSMVLWDRTLPGWRAPERTMPDSGDTAMISCIDFDMEIHRYGCFRDAVARHRAWVVFGP